MFRLNGTFVRQVLFLSGIWVVLFLSGCAGRGTPEAEIPVTLPSTFSSSGYTELEGKWWLAFNDPKLNEIIEKALIDNFSLQSSWDRLKQAKAVYNKANAGFFPVMEGEGSGTHAIDSRDESTAKTDTLILGLSVSYEVDLWGRIGSSVEAARLDLEATTSDLDAAAMTLSAEVAATWYQLVQQTASLELIKEQIKTNTKALELITVQFRTGQVSIADVLQQRQLIESQEGQKSLLLSQKGQTEHKLALLVGQAPKSPVVGVPSQLIELPPLPSTGIPVEFVRARPDIRSSFLALQAADQRVAVAVADTYPSLRLSASFETINTSGSAIFRDYMATLLAGVTAPLIDGGLRKAEVERTRAVAAEKLHDYGQVVLNAIGEVEDALLIEQQQKVYLESLQAQLDLAYRSMDQVKARYLNGVENYQRVLTALTSLQTLQQTKITAQKDLLLNRITLCRALGRGWEYSGSKGHS